MADPRPAYRLPRVHELRSRVAMPAAVTRQQERWSRTTVPRPRLLGLAVGVFGLLLLMLLAGLLFGGTDLGEDGPAPNAYFEQ